jgi:hypothetical protein
LKRLRGELGISERRGDKLIMVFADYGVRRITGGMANQLYHTASKNIVARTRKRAI